MAEHVGHGPALLVNRGRPAGDGTYCKATVSFRIAKFQTVSKENKYLRIF
jgi:hypothetical protein